MIETNFQHTEIGDIPADWKVVVLGNEGGIMKESITPLLMPDQIFCEYSMPSYDNGKKPQYVKGASIHSNRTVISGEVLLYNKLNVRQKRVWHTVCRKKEHSVCSSEFLPYYSDTIYLPYLKYILEQDSSTNYFISKSKGTSNSQKRINPQDLLNYAIALPESYDEQIKISEVLSHLDDLLECVDKTISKKTSIKQGAMQMLLTGKKRLGSFVGTWQEVSLGDIGEVRMCKRVMKYQTTPKGEIPFFKIGTFGKVPDAFISKELFEKYKSQYNYPNKGDILLSAAGTIGRTVVYDGKPSYFQDSNIVWIDNNEKLLINKLLYYIYDTISWVTDTGTIPRIYNDVVKSIKFIIPPTIEEQQAIAKVLSDMDDEIHEQEAKRDKYKAIKQGVMQQLLSGKVRLI